MELKKLAFVILVVIGPALAFRNQRVAVTGVLYCGSQPANNVRVKLYDEDDGPDPDDELDAGYTDARGAFTLSGDTTELTPIDPVLKIYHDCDDGSTPCQRKWRFKLPNKYINHNQPMNIGTLNLEARMKSEERDCFH